MLVNQGPSATAGGSVHLAATMPIGTMAFEDRRHNHARDLYAWLARRHTRQLLYLLPPDARVAIPQHPRARIDAHRYEWAIADSRDDG